MEARGRILDRALQAANAADELLDSTVGLKGEAGAVAAEILIRQSAARSALALALAAIAGNLEA